MFPPAHKFNAFEGKAQDGKQCVKGSKNDFHVLFVFSRHICISETGKPDQNS